MTAKPDKDFWRGRRVLLTGHTGFKGAWLALWLRRLGAQVTGVALPPDSEPNLFTAARVAESVDSRFVDIRDPDAIRGIVREARPEVVLHLAAQALVRPGYAAPLETFATNVLGTANVLDALRAADGVRAAVVVTTDKVYRNHERQAPYTETDPLGGHDPYSASKAAAEIVTASYRDAYLRDLGITVTTARAGNVIGGGDWSVDRLIPDAVRAWQSGQVLHVRRPGAVRPWQHVIEPLAGYLRLAEMSCTGASVADAYNFGPDPDGSIPVGRLVALARDAYGSGEAEAGDGTEGPHEAGLLTLAVARAHTDLGVHPTWPVDAAVARTMRWYRRHADGEDARALCDADINDFEAGR